MLIPFVSLRTSLCRTNCHHQMRCSLRLPLYERWLPTEVWFPSWVDLTWFHQWGEEQLLSHIWLKKLLRIIWARWRWSVMQTVCSWSRLEEWVLVSVFNAFFLLKEFLSPILIVFFSVQGWVYVRGNQQEPRVLQEHCWWYPILAFGRRCPRQEGKKR